MRAAADTDSQRIPAPLLSFLVSLSSCVSLGRLAARAAPSIPRPCNGMRPLTHAGCGLAAAIVRYHSSRGQAHGPCGPANCPGARHAPVVLEYTQIISCCWWPFHTRIYYSRYVCAHVTRISSLDDALWFAGSLLCFQSQDQVRCEVPCPGIDHPYEPRLS